MHCRFLRSSLKRLIFDGRFSSGTPMSPLRSPRRSSRLRSFVLGIYAVLTLGGFVIPNASIAEEVSAEEPPVAAKHWAYQPIQSHPVPEVKDTAAVRTPIDAFLLRQLERQGLGFSPEATREELIRRASFDLLGLPPTPEEIAQFVNDARPDAYEQLLARLLDSPHYGERWGRIWLDAVRYSDTAGFNADPLRPLAWKYRDYVIRALNDDVPYDRFIAEQLAGDELYPAEERAWIATGFYRLMPDESNASDLLLARQEILNDATSVVGSVLLGQSLGCAQCHDHKFDPLTQKDFYRLQAFFAGLVPEEKFFAANDIDRKIFHERETAWKKSHEAPFRTLHALESAAYAKAYGEKRLRFPESMWEAYRLFPDDRTAFQRQILFFSERQIRGEIKEEKMLAMMSPEEQGQFKELREETKKISEDRPRPAQQGEAMVATEVSDIPATYLLGAGSYANPEEEVQPGFPEVINAVRETSEPQFKPSRESASGRRTALVNWLFAPQNPLTSRVMANRIWQSHFGRGLVENANDFGTQTPDPAHPELLDWLAKEFSRPAWDGLADAKIPWSLKRLHRLIMLSSAYRQSSRSFEGDDVTTARMSKDPGNRGYWKYPARRLDSESLRDALLTVSGNLNPKMYGSPIHPPLPAAFGKQGAWPETKDASEQRRRSVYILAKRNMPYPLLATFDQPDMHESCARRAVTTTGLQALFLLNSDVVLDAAQRLAGKILVEESPGDPRRIIERAYRRTLGRTPQDHEVQLALAFLNRQQELISQRVSAEETVLQPLGGPVVLDPSLGGAWVDFCHALLNLNEFLYVD